ncbi:TetR/AcrR family transcriptional regulator [Planomonospora sphaerica]|nr:TetR/AcrR family transcriptional regulator [Planomonospora sphaerica]
MTPLDTPPGTTSMTPAEAGRDRRAERILDAAAELLAARGYRRVTVEDVARRTGVGRGTVHLHFATKEALFLTVLMRSQRRMTGRLIEDMRADPAAVLPGELARSAYLLIHHDPVARAVLTADSESLDSLGRSAPMLAGGLVETRERVAEGYFEVLRAHGLVRADSPLRLQRHAFAAVLTGFLLSGPAAPGEEPGVEARAGMLAGVVRSAFETPAGPEAVRAAAPEVIALCRSLHDRLHEEIGRQKLT